MASTHAVHPETNTRPNIVLICVDQMRGDAMSGVGNEVVQTPYLDALAASGSTFEHAYTATPTCVPARVALFTGKGPNGQDYSRGAQLKFEKSVGAKYLELKISDRQRKRQPEFEIRDWE